VAVHLTGGQPSYAILPNQAYDHIAPPDGPEGMALLYHGSLALRQPGSRAALAAIRTRCAAPVFLDVNLRSPWWDTRRVAGLLDGARWCKLNHQELQVLAGPGNPLAAARRLIERHPIERLFVTLGTAGALSLGRAGDCKHISPAGGVAVVDTVGAGDAFAAVLIAGLLRGWPLASTLERAQALASAICGLRGALPREPRFYPQWDLG
jgi:fructokinase